VAAQACAAINTFETLFTFNGRLALTAGQVVDIKVDDLGNFLFDSIMLRGTITSAAMPSAPEPVTLCPRLASWPWDCCSARRPRGPPDRTQCHPARVG